MVRAHQLIIMCSKNNLAFIPLFAPFLDFQNNTGRQLIIEVIYMKDVRFKIIQYKAQFFPRLCGIDGL